MSGSRITDMNESLNPFDRVTENPEYPFARIYRESFWQGISDTYDVIVGNHYRISANDEDTHAGFLDGLIFPLVSQKLMHIAFPTLKYKGEPPREYGAAPMPIRVAAGFVACVLEVPRAIIGAVLTLCVASIVATVHAISFYKANKLKNEVKNLKVNETSRGQTSTTSAIKTLGDVLRHDIRPHSGEVRTFHGNLRDISVEVDKNNNSTTYTTGKGGKFTRQFTTLPENSQDQVQAAPVIAFKELNIGGRRFR